MKRIARFLSLAFVAMLIALPVHATVSSETTRVKYTCDGTTTVYAYPFKIYENDDILAVKAITSTGAETTLVLNTDYTVSGAGGAGGNVTLTAGSVCGSGYTLTILRNIELTQETDYVDGQAFSAESLESALDKVTLIQQQQEEKIGRAPKLPKTSSITDIALPNPSANNYIGWNAGATNLENKAVPVVTTATQYEIDALVSYGGGTAYTQATIEAALTAIGTSDKKTLLLRPGTWVISSNADWSAYTNVTFNVVPGAVISHGAFTLNIPNLEINGLHQRFSGTGTVTLTQIPYVYPDWWTTNAIPGTTDMSTALTSAVQSGVKHIKLLGTKYAYTGWTIPDGTSALTIEGTAVEYGSGSTQLWYTPTSGNGLYFAGEADYFTIKNVTFNAHGAESDTVCIANIIGASKVMRSPTFENIHIYGWLGGIRIGFAMRARIIGGYFSGQGQAVADGVGILMGWDAADSTNVAVIRDAWITGYETGVWNKYSTTLDIYSTDISLATTGLKADVGATYVYDSYLESTVTAIDTSGGGYLYGNWTISNITGPNPGTVTISGTHRFGRNGYGQARVVAYRDSGGAQNGGPTVVVFNGETEDTEGNFNIATGVFTAGFAGFYQINAIVGFSATATGQSVTIQLYKGGVLVPYSDNVAHSSLAATLSSNLSRLIWLDIGDTIDIRVTTSASLSWVTNATRLDIMSVPW